MRAVSGRQAAGLGIARQYVISWRERNPANCETFIGGRLRVAESTPLSDWWAPAGQQKYLVLQGTEDQAAPPENGELLKQELGARVTLIPFPGAGHLMLVTEPKKAAAAIVSFLR
jgi:pimeloyl-ACP methyl ester carboxylesterase